MNELMLGHQARPNARRQFLRYLQEKPEGGGAEGHTPPRVCNVLMIAAADDCSHTNESLGSLKMLARQYLVIQQLARCILERLYKPSGEYKQT